MTRTGAFSAVRRCGLIWLLAVCAMVGCSEPHEGSREDELCPSNIVEQVGFASPVYDAWGRAVCCVTNTAEGSVVIRSAGQDGLQDTSDDVVGNLELFGERNYLLSVRWECGFDGGGRLDAWHETKE